VSGRDAAYMRGQLASVGILIAPAADPRAAVIARPPAPPTVDRELVREILVSADAPAHHLEWLVASCPSIAAALTYRRPW